MNPIVVKNYPNRRDEYTISLSNFLNEIQQLAQGIAETHNVPLNGVMESFIHAIFGFDSNGFRNVPAEHEITITVQVENPNVLNNALSVVYDDLRVL